MSHEVEQTVAATYQTASFAGKVAFVTGAASGIRTHYGAGVRAPGGERGDR
jgi:hypothetical protein